MEETFRNDIIDGKMINWDKLSIEELNEIKTEAEKREQEIYKNIMNIFEKITEE